MSNEERKSLYVAEMGLKQANNYFAFITPKLYAMERYEVRQIDYWFWSELKGEFQKHRVTDALKYEDIEKYVNEGIIYIKCQDTQNQTAKEFQTSG